MIEEEIRSKARDEGFDTVGITDATVGERDRRALERFVAQGRHGDMAWMAETAERRGDPRCLMTGLKSIIALGANYGPAGEAFDAVGIDGRATISVYARTQKDYHDTLKKRLKRIGRWMAETYGCDIKVFVDTAPVLEKAVAEKAGVGWIGKHTNLVSRGFGSWLFLAEIFTDLELKPDRPEPDHCGTCDRCLSACPTAAFPNPYELDALRCVSYLTIEHKGTIAPDLMEAMGSRVYGCDDCLAACPWNKYAETAQDPALLPRIELTAPRLSDLAQLDDEAFRKVFAGSPIKRTGRDRFLRNVAIALGNSQDPSAPTIVETLCDDPSPLVRDAAEWARRRLASDRAKA